MALWYEDREDIRPTVLMIGVTGAGKSSLATSLLGEDPDDKNASFLANGGGKSVTTDTTAKLGQYLARHDRSIKLVDSPGHGDSEGRDDAFRTRMIQQLREIQTVHAIVWVINAEKPRVDKQDQEFLRIVYEVFGPGFLKNLVINFSYYEHSETAERKRRRQKKSIESLRASIVASLTKGLTHEIPSLQPEIPTLAIDALYDKDDPVQKASFLDEAEKLWEILESLNGFSMTDLKELKSRQKTLQEDLKLLQSDPNRSKEKEEELKRQLKCIQDQLARQNSLPSWAWITLAFLGVVVGGPLGWAARMGVLAGAYAVEKVIEWFKTAADETQDEGKAEEFRSMAEALQPFKDCTIKE